MFINHNQLLDNQCVKCFSVAPKVNFCITKVTEKRCANGAVEVSRSYRLQHFTHLHTSKSNTNAIVIKSIHGKNEVDNCCGSQNQLMKCRSINIRYPNLMYLPIFLVCPRISTTKAGKVHSRFKFAVTASCSEYNPRANIKTPSSANIDDKK